MLLVQLWAEQPTHRYHSPKGQGIDFLLFPPQLKWSCVVFKMRNIIFRERLHIFFFTLTPNADSISVSSEKVMGGVGCECPRQGHGICFWILPLSIWETSVRPLTLSIQSIHILFCPGHKFALGFLCTPSYITSSGVTASKTLLPPAVLGNDVPLRLRHSPILIFPLRTSNQTHCSPSLLTYQGQNLCQALCESFFFFF